MYLNTDGNTSTGYISGVGSDYMVEGWFEDGMAYPGLYRHTTADQEAWSFDEVSAAVMSNSASAVLGNGHSAFEGSIALTSFTTGVTSLQVMVSAVDEDWNDVGSLPEDGSLLTVPMPEIDIPTSGSCGENLTWSFAEGVLTITGTGAMTSSPWNPLKSDIQSVVMSEGITGIMEGAFSGCTNLTTVNIPSSVVWVENAFQGCTSLPVIDNIRYAGNYLLEAVDKTLSSYTIQETTKWIAPNAFDGCSAISITVPNNVIAIGEYAFYGIINVNYNGSADGAPWGARVFNGCVDGWLVYSDNSKKDLYYCSPDAKGEIVLPEGLLIIESHAFHNCANITNINIPSSVYFIGDWAFEGCSSLPVVGGLRYADTYLVEMEDYSLSTYTIREGTRWIGKNVFAWAQMLPEITLPESLEYIGENAFAYCTGLTSLTIPANVKSIGEAAFIGCTGLKSITCQATTPPTLEYFWNGVFADVDKTTPLYVPEASIDAYKSADQWLEFKNISAMRIFYYVRFVDWDGTQIDLQDIDEGQAAIAPADPVRAGYTFIGWDQSFDHIIAPLTVTAQYIINYDVFFLSYDGTLLKEESVPANTAATAPTAPSRDGYVFTGWSGELNNVNARTFAVAQYEPEAPVYNTQVTYLDKDGGFIAMEYVTLNLPTAPAYDGYTFTGWVAIPTDVTTGGIVINATYTENSGPATDVQQNIVPTDGTQKIIRDGQVYILQNDQIYTVTGQKVRF